MRVWTLSALALATSVAASNLGLEQSEYIAKRNLKSKADIERGLADLAEKKSTAVAYSKRASSYAAANVTNPDACPGYTASHVKTTAYSLTATLSLAGPACNVYGPDLASLSLQVTYETCAYIVSCWRCLTMTRPFNSFVGTHSFATFIFSLSHPCQDRR